MPWLAEHAMHALLPNHDNAEFCRQTNNCQNGLFLAALF
jgi:hypothetical protein